MLHFCNPCDGRDWATEAWAVPVCLGCLVTLSISVWEGCFHFDSQSWVYSAGRRVRKIFSFVNWGSFSSDYPHAHSARDVYGPHMLRLGDFLTRGTCMACMLLAAPHAFSSYASVPLNYLSSPSWASCGLHSDHRKNPKILQIVFCVVSQCS